MIEEEKKRLYLDEPVVSSFFIGEMGWMIQRWQGYLRHLKQTKYQDHKFLILMNVQYHCLLNDFITFSVDLPPQFYALGLEQDCYEAPFPDDPPGSLTPPEIYSDLIKFIRNFYNKSKAIEIFPPRGASMWVESQPQIFAGYKSTEKISSDRPILTIFPRGRSRAPQRNVPEYVWKEVVDRLKDSFTIVLGGTPSGSALVDYEDENVINLIRYSGDDKLEKIMTYLNSSELSISSQSGPTHLSLACSTPSYIIGHEKERHVGRENRWKTSTSFRTTQDYRAIDANTIITDIFGFLKALSERPKAIIPTEQEFESELLQSTSILHKEIQDGMTE